MKKLLYFSIFLLILNSCRDKCKDVRPTSAGFKMYETLERNDLLISGKKETIQVEEDTFMVNSTITFEALDGDAIAYDWLIGEDDRPRTGKSISVEFNKPNLGGKYTFDIRLIIRKKPNTKCHPNDDGVDTLTRKLVLLDFPDSPLYGKYWGADTDRPNEPYEIEIFFGKSPCIVDPKQCGSYYGDLPLIKGLPLECASNNSIYYVPFTEPSSAFVAVFGEDDRATICFSNNQQGIVKLSPDRKSITIEYYPFFKSFGKIKKIFKGKRI